MSLFIRLLACFLVAAHLTSPAHTAVGAIPWDASSLFGGRDQAIYCHRQKHGWRCQIRPEDLDGFEPCTGRACLRTQRANRAIPPFGATPKAQHRVLLECPSSLYCKRATQVDRVELELNSVSARFSAQMRSWLRRANRYDSAALLLSVQNAATVSGPETLFDT